MRRLVLDIETTPNRVYSWGLFNQNIAVNQIEEPGDVLCWGAKWYGEDEYFFDSVHCSEVEDMLAGVYHLMDEADVVIHYNGTYFDIPVLNREFVQQGWGAPAPYQNIDLLTTVRKQFRFPSNKMSYVANALGVGEKPQSFDMELWKACMAGDDDAWVKMEEYNLNDVDLTEAVYDAMMPWIKSHPNYGLYKEGVNHSCPHCGSENLQRRGVSRTRTMIYQRFQCQDCGAWSRARKRDKDAAVNELVGVY